MKSAEDSALNSTLGPLLEESGGASNNLPPAPSVMAGLNKDIDRIQEQHIIFSNKFEVEERKGGKLDAKIKAAEARIRELYNNTRGGAVIVDDTVKYKKQISKLEKTLQTIRIQHSKSNTENLTLKSKITDARTDKLLYLQIHHDMGKELELSIERCKEATKEISNVVDGKQKLKMETTTIKHQMINEMEAFNREVDAVKYSVQTSQVKAMESIRWRLNQSTLANSKWRNSPKKPKGPTEAEQKAVMKDAIAEQQREYAEVLLAVKSIGLESINEFLMLHHQSEEQVFGMYKSIQTLNEELEALEVENKKLEAELAVQSDHAKDIEKHNNNLKVQLETQIANIEKAMSLYQSSYNANCQILDSVSHFLMNILRNIASDDEAVDQQILGTGVTDRSVDDLLGVIEQRVDDLIQMLRAVSKQPIYTEDFLRTSDIPPHVEKHATQFSSVHGVQATMPSSVEGPEEDEEEPDENGKIHPVNIGQLKDLMQKKMQRGLKKSAAFKQNAQVGSAFYLPNVTDDRMSPTAGGEVRPAVEVIKRRDRDVG